MRDLYDTIATGPVQGDSHRAILKSVAADLAGMPHETRETGSGQLSEGKAVSEWPKDRNGAQRAPHYEDLGLAMAMLGFSDRGYVSPRGVASIYDAALRAMGPDPIPLAGTEEWAESDEAYRARLVSAAQASGAYIMSKEAGVSAGYRLDDIGHSVRFPRARLVLVPVQQEPQP